MADERQRAKSQALTPHSRDGHGVGGRDVGYGDGMVTLALRATSHVAAWIVWQSMKVSLLDDLEAPRPPAEEPARKAA